jgi:glycosyltransferase involved in cell wall biosynthesis
VTKISIAMATYNGEAFIRQQLDSFSRQTLLPSELIVCDDGSTDATVSIVSDFSRSAPFPVKIFNNPARLGYTANFLQAARMCEGDLIAFSDQDDEWFPRKLERVLRASQGADALLFSHAEEWVDKSGKSLGIVFPTDRRFRKYLRANDFNGHTIVIRRSLLEITSHSLTPDICKTVGGDIEFNYDVLLLEVATAMNKVLFISDVLGQWRLYSESNHPETKVWTKQVRPPPRVRTSFADWFFPPDLAQRYADAGSACRKHAAIRSCIVRDLAAVEGDTPVSSARLLASINRLTKMANVMELRARFYGPQSRKARLRLMLAGAAMGQYRKEAQGGVGIRNALRDLVACFFY